MAPTGGLDEPVEVLASTGPERGRRPRWLVWGVVLVLLAGAGGLWLLRHQATKAQFRHLQSEWMSALSLDDGRAVVIRALNSKATPSDAGLVDRALMQVQRQEAGRLAALRAGVSAGWTRDDDVEAVAAAERSALSAEIVDLHRPRVLVGWSGAAQRAIDQAEHLLAAGRHRFDEATPARRPPARLHAADPVLAQLRHLVDGSLPARLLVSVDVGTRHYVRLLDLRRGTVESVNASTRSVLGRDARVVAMTTGRGRLVVQTRTGTAFAISRSLTGQPRRLGQGTVLPAVDPGAVWLYGYGHPAHVVEVSVSGRRLAGPFPTPVFEPDRYPAGLTVPAGFVVSGTGYPGTPSIVPTGIWLWNPRSGPSLHLLAAGCAAPLATHGALLAWLRCDDQNPGRASLRVTNTSTGRTRVISEPRGALPALSESPAAAFSPDGRHLAYYCVGTGFGGYALAINDLGSGTTALIRQPPIDAVGDGISAPPGALMWSQDSQRVFYATGASPSGRSAALVPFASYRLGAARGEDIRFHPQPATLLAVVD